MRILFLYPSLISGWMSYRENGNNESSYMDHGFAMISAVLKQAGHQTFSMDLRSFSGWENFERTLKEQQFDMTLVSFFSANERFAHQAVEIVKRNFPNKPIVGGGIHLSVTKTRKYTNIDSIVLGEGEPHILNIVNAVANNQPLKEVYDLEMVSDLNTLPYVDRALFNPRMEQTSPLLAQLPQPFITVVAGRGCWGKCKFCAPSRNLISGDKIRIRSVDNFLGELIHLNRTLDNGIGSIMIHDDLLGSKKWMEEFVEKWRANLPYIPWWCQLRADVIIRMKEFVPRLADIGLTYVSIGLESGSQRMLDFLDKGTTVEENIEAASILHESGINIFGNYIYGLPTETKEDLDGTERMLAAIKPAFHSASTYTSYPGSYIYDWIVENKYWAEPEDHYSTIRYPFERKIKGIDYAEIARRGSEWRQLYTSPLRTPKRIHKTTIYIKDDYKYLIEKPIASVIIVTYNRPENLRTAIQSIFNQTLKNWELIILDYTENQDVNKSVRDWATNDNRVKWIAHTKNIDNISYCWNEGLDMCRGKYWCTLDDDNEKLPDYLKAMTEYLEQHPEKDAAVCPMEIRNGGTSSTVYIKPPNYDDLLAYNKIDSGQVVYRKTILEKIGCFDERLESYDDWDYMLRVFNLNNKSGSAFGWVDGHCLCTYTMHPQQRTHRPSIRTSWEHTIPAVKSKNLKEVWKVKLANATIEVTESQKQFAENIESTLRGVSSVQLVDDNADIVFVNGIIYRYTEEDFEFLKKKNPQAEFVFLLIEDPQAVKINMRLFHHAHWIVTNDLNAYNYYYENTPNEESRKKILLWNNLYLSNKMVEFVKNYNPEKTYDVCMVGHAYASRVNFMRELLPSISGKSVIIIGNDWKQHKLPGVSMTYDTLDEINAAEIAMKSRVNIIKHRTDMDLGGFPIVKPASINRGYIEAAYRSVLLIDNDRPYDTFDPNTIIRYENAADCANKINEVLSNYNRYAGMVTSAFEKSISSFTYHEALIKILNCVRSCRYNVKIR